MEVEADNNEMKEFKEKISSILEDETFKDKRSSKLGLEDFLKLLYYFNKNGIHFY